MDVATVRVMDTGMAKATDMDTSHGTVPDVGAAVIRVAMDIGVVTRDIKEVSTLRSTHRWFRRPDVTARQTQ